MSVVRIDTVSIQVTHVPRTVTVWRVAGQAVASASARGVGSAASRRVARVVAGVATRQTARVARPTAGVVARPSLGPVVRPVATVARPKAGWTEQDRS